MILQLAGHESVAFAGVFSRACPKKLLDFFDIDMLQLFEFERFLSDGMIP
jgi:hypothetical protein